MRYLRLATTFICVSWLATGCSREEESARPALERAQERLAEGTDKARKALAAARKRWDELQPEAEQAIAELEARAEKLINDSEALKRLPPDALERMRKHLDAMREKLAEAKAAQEQGNTDLAVEKADAVQQEGAAAEEWLVERPDPR
jgi:hypothetical protein